MHSYLFKIIKNIRSKYYFSQSTLLIELVEKYSSQLFSILIQTKFLKKLGSIYE